MLPIAPALRANLETTETRPIIYVNILNVSNLVARETDSIVPSISVVRVLVVKVAQVLRCSKQQLPYH